MFKYKNQFKYYLLKMFEVIIACGISVVLGFPKTTVDNNADWKIVGGQEAEDGQFPYQISLQIDGEHDCGGSILNKRWILTAAHCVLLWSSSKFTVVAGTNALNTGGVRYNVTNVIWHEKYLLGAEHDVALVQVDKDIAFGDNVKTIALGKGNASIGINATVSGWGITTFPSSYQNKLRYIGLTIISTDECKKQWPNITENNVCTLTKKGEGTCRGDSGCPLVANGEQVGIVSFGKACALGVPDVYARVSSYVKWIESKMAL